jgi:hypothetical protein
MVCATCSTPVSHTGVDLACQVRGDALVTLSEHFDGVIHARGTPIVDAASQTLEDRSSLRVLGQEMAADHRGREVRGKEMPSVAQLDQVE